VYFILLQRISFGYLVFLGPTAAILLIVSIELLEYPLLPHFEIFAEPVEKKEVSKFSRNCANWMSLIPFLDISDGRAVFGGPPPAMLSVWGHGMQLVRAANERDINVSVLINMIGD
jgi:hypothetical protein